ncbi:helix-turn-helix domain-containing protein [Massilia aurea]|uniref:helix-turn-helix domain-containing protein n=1 Tax=Massilia aurea TaxID=373040 RepID=UPI000F2DE8A8|nr:helix-turn-helix transcriptional regulator [Massilia aurea]
MQHSVHTQSSDAPSSNVLGIRKTIGLAISNARQNAGLTQEDVAERLGIGPEAVSRLERGIGSITAERLVVLADMFGCRSDQLLLGSSSRQDDQAAAIAQLLDGLAPADRAFVIENVERLTEFLRSKPSGSKGRRP